jgi:hypothetical protein
MSSTPVGDAGATDPPPVAANQQMKLHNGKQATDPVLLVINFNYNRNRKQARTSHNIYSQSIQALGEQMSEHRQAVWLALLLVVASYLLYTTVVAPRLDERYRSEKEAKRVAAAREGAERLARDETRRRAIERQQAELRSIAAVAAERRYAIEKVVVSKRLFSDRLLAFVC